MFGFFNDDSYDSPSRQCRGRHGHHHGRRGFGPGRGWRGGGPGFGRGPFGFGPSEPWRGRGPARWAGHVAELIGASPEQEEAIDDVLRVLIRDLRHLRGEAAATKQGLGEAFVGEQLDEGRLAELFTRHDELLAGARKSVVRALSRLHELLEPEQRERLVGWLGRRGPGFGPYRG
ncbi:periplasmic heavy metal sensor [Pseudenhygromyxa sp. WMMC2535]|uniref:periplasmic heavy metal sensor n=1 Tax=Pseudenhygromyxa sp. WMMC2535 TaxID=2712867 RepID=UPI0015551735|nr:periplasmic heavy metal sensor [Pseudenhygromyxa sp. WMMC2535]NVB40779.1 periplasmic heavy metal sensor [Pseudenhygromyxa sp. WMMC2535]